MLGDGGPADRQTFGELVDSSWRAPEFLQQMAPVRIRNGIEWVRDRHARTLGEFPRSGKKIVRCGMCFAQQRPLHSSRYDAPEPIPYELRAGEEGHRVHEGIKDLRLHPPDGPGAAGGRDHGQREERCRGFET